MGTGGSAAVDSNMAVSIMSKLLKAGLSYDCSLAVVNSSLMIKSDEESLATLDVVDFNLFSGKAQINKAGACTTYVKKNSKLYRKDMQSLPIGILNEVQFAKEDITLSEGDMILMISDGALFGDDKWIEKLFMSWGDESMEELSQKVVDEAIKRRNDGHDDDITALAVKVIEN
jgi:stage II sporulation protein E